jgi:type II secretory pathway pseudopilin PulG
MFSLRSGLHSKITGRSDGFTLVELVIIIVTLGILAAVAIPKMGSMTENAKINSTKDEMRRIKTAIVGDARAVSAGEYTNCGFEGDVGFAPSSLTDLTVKPDSVVTYDKFTRLGWNGPYIDSAGQNYLSDAWEVAYSYDAVARTITSTGPDPDIILSF